MESSLAITTKNSSFQNRLAKQKLVAGESLVMASPGGVSCSYAVEFGGPYKSCNKATTNINPDHAHGLFEVYPGSWVAPFERALNPALYSNSHSTKARFNSTAIPPLQLHGSELNGPGNSSVILQQASASCGLGRAKNIMNNIYSNNLQTRNVTVEPIELLTNLVMRAEDEIVVFPAFRNNRRIELGIMYTQPAPSTSPSKLGSQVSSERLFATSKNAYQGNSKKHMGYMTATDHLTWDSGSNYPARNGTVIDGTRFNNASGHSSRSEKSRLSFNITKDTMNEYLFKMTTSIMMSYGMRRTRANNTKLATINVYSFSEAPSLLLP
ncbi:hypothetical protein B2J93_4001 [Marssonina coronariae]|uniref:Uncharacterized protein n=1 Tax=Diplocarpon coronariae TaxID=2795749 RepID=A0A218Z9G9_9HELO|nr:hypothetical protein B2J93_4001 [Marssonina coronariae]